MTHTGKSAGPLARFAAGMTLMAALSVAAATAQAGSLPDKVEIGGLLPLTGNAGYIGNELRIGLDMAMEDYEASRKPGLPSVEIVYVDSQADPRMGFQGYQRLVTRDGVKVIILTYTSVAKAIAPEAERDRTAMLNITQGPVTTLGDNFTSILPPYSMQGLAVATYAVKNLGVKRLATIYENSEAFVAESNNLRDVTCPQAGCEVVAAEEIPAGSTDVAAQVTAALAANPDAVFPLGIQTQSIPIVRELATRGFKGSVIGNGELGAIVNAGKGDLIDGAIYSIYSFDKESPAYKRVAEAVIKKTGKEPSQYLLMGYQAGQVTAGVLAKMDEMGLDWSGDNFVKAQISGKFDTVAGTVSFLPDGRIVEPMTMMKIENGKPVAIGKIQPEDLIER